MDGILKQGFRDPYKGPRDVVQRGCQTEHLIGLFSLREAPENDTLIYAKFMRQIDLKSLLPSVKDLREGSEEFMRLYGLRTATEECYEQNRINRAYSQRRKF